MPVCDGCGRSVDEAHIRRRIERLERATRFRPIHISVLLIDSAPLDRPEDFFYALPNDRSRSTAGQAYFNGIAKLAGTAIDSSHAPESVLAEFQRRGFFLASAVECPVDDSAELTAMVRRLAPTVLRRVQYSYKPKQIALVSQLTSALIDTFSAAGWRDRLILDNAAPFSIESIASRLTAALAQTA